MKRRQRGFTLIELLVVISIISLLSSVVWANLNSAKAKARDAKRLSEIKQLQNALILYASDHGDVYPDDNNTWPNDCSGSSGLKTFLNSLLVPNYLPKIPTDPNYPNDPWPQCYYYKSNSNCYTGDPVHSFILVFQTESATYNLPSWNNETRRYCVYYSD